MCEYENAGNWSFFRHMHTTDNPMNLNVSQWWPTHVNRTRVGYHIEPRLVSIDYTLLGEVRHVYIM